MSDSRDKPELETLSYKPECECAACRLGETCILDVNGHLKSKNNKKPELEPLDYKRNPEMPKPLKRGFLGLNSAVIKPETRINNVEIDDKQPVEQPKYDKCRYCGAGRIVRPSGEWQFYCHCDEPDKRPNNKSEQPIKTGCAIPAEQPNQDLMIITEIEGLMSQVNEKIISLPAGNFAKDFNKYATIGKALEEIDLFQKTTLFDLRKAFE